MCSYLLGHYTVSDAKARRTINYSNRVTILEGLKELYN